MKVSSRIVLLAGLGATAVVLALGAFGALQRIEWWSQDQRFLNARQRADPMGDAVRLVAIDDRALDTIGRWPWSRDLVAMALDEVHRAGAKAVATDVLFTDVQKFPAEDGREADPLLADAIGRTPTVLAVNMDEGRLDASLWKTPEGTDALRRLVRAAAEDITRDAEDIAGRAALQGDRRSRFLERAMQFKKLVAWDTLVRLREEGHSPKDADAFRLALTAGNASLGEFPEKNLMVEAYERDRSFGWLARFMAPGKGEGSALDAPPIAAFAERAAGVGFVNSLPDRDGQHRRVRPFWPTPYGALPQFGMAAGLLQLGLSPAEVRVEDGELRFPDGRVMPLERGEIRIDWPTAVFENDVDGVRAGETGVVAIGALVDLARQRGALARQEGQYRDLLADIAALQGLPPEAIAKAPVDDRTRAVIKDQGEFLAGDLEVAGTDDLGDLPEEDRRKAGLYREWWKIDRELPQSQRRIEEASAKVRSALEGRLVFVGWIATGAAADMINTVFGPRTPGVYVHAAIADMVIAWHSVVVWPPWTAYPAGALLGAICALAAWRRGAGASTAVCLLLAGGWAILAGGVAFVAADTMIPVAIPVLCAVGAQAVGVSTAAVVHQREKARITRQFRARVSPQLVDLLSSDPDAVSMRGEQREATILFGDLAGFTTISEKLGSEAVVGTLNLYMSAMATELTNRRAYVNKFLGDGLLAFWSAFGPEAEQGQLAAEACRACQRVVAEIGRRPDRQGLPKVSLRLGVATGVVTIGDCGAPPDLNDYTVIGDSANLAARLESANKQFGTAILFDGRTRELIRDPGGLPIVPLGQVVVVGQSVPIELFTMLVDDTPAGWIEGIGRAVEAFRRADFAACADAWDAFERQFGATKIAVPFREALSDPNDRRDGVLRLRAK